jgi:hypothetical protein|tara:strand:- start:1057 stop:3054 length:1998 start_codon:yes stop_codon:yes gene_type:complete
MALMATSKLMSDLISERDIGKLLSLISKLDINDPEIKRDYDCPSVNNICTDSVGIWHKDQPDVYRRKTHKDGCDVFWANTDIIGPKEGRRVVLIGESVARGMHYDPWFTPAQVLEKNLQRYEDSTEVIDLARTDMGPIELVDTIKTSQILKPDTIVVFAGNNWLMPGMASQSDQYRLCCFLKENPPLEELKNYMFKILGELTDKFIRFVEKIAENIPIVILIPEFNLVDWTPQMHCPWMEKNQYLIWSSILLEIDKLLKEKKYESAEYETKQLNKLDGGLSPIGAFKLGNAYLKSDTTKARRFLETAKDACILFGETTPRCYTVIQEKLRSINHKKIRVVDIPHLLSEYNSKSLPNKRFFLDYCHMTEEGIRLVMAQTAVDIMALHGIYKEWRAIFYKSDAPLNAVDASARLAGALYNHRMLQPQSIIQYHCTHALQHSDTVTSEVNALLNYGLSIPSNYICASYGELGEISSAIHDRMSYPKVNWRTFLALKEALSNSKPYVIDHENIWNSLILEHGIDKNSPKANLLTSAFGADADPGEIVSCREQLIEYQFFTSEPSDFKLEIVVRTPYESNGIFKIKCNDTVFNYQIKTDWVFLKAHLSVNCIIHGMNSLQFFWPNIELQSVDIHSIMQEEAYWLFAQGEYIDIRMVFGEFQKMEIILNDS